MMRRINLYTCRLGLFVASLASCTFSAAGQGYHFNPLLLTAQSAQADLSLFERGGQLPGNYDVDILLNGERVDTRTVSFKLKQDAAGHFILTPCLMRSQLSAYGVRVDNFRMVDEGKGHCFRLNVIPGALAELDFNAQSLQLSIPQIYIRPKVAGIAPKTLWDDGIPALLMNYDASETWNVLHHSGGHDSSQSAWLQLSPGANLGPWRLRNSTVWDQITGQRGKWQTISTYAERGVDSIKSRLTVGDSNTPADIFDSVPFRGLMLASDDEMVPSSQYQYTPVVRGVARTQARVEVKQNGYTIYNRVVAPGPFALTDLNSGSASGDLQVTIWETDGHPQVFTVPFQTPAVAVKEGYLRYGLITGQYRPTTGAVNSTKIMEATAMYGLPYSLTLYGGFQGARYFQSASGGLGTSLGELGAVSADVTQNRSQFRVKPAEQGRSFRLRYSWLLAATDTTLALVLYRYNQNGYNTLSDVLDTWQHDGLEGGVTGLRKKSRSGLTVTQGLGVGGYLTFSGYQDRYDGRNDESTVNAGCSFPLGDMTMSLNWSQNHSVESSGQTVSLWLSVPLQRWLGGNTSATYRWSGSSSGSTHAAGLSGDILNSRVHWAASQEYRPDYTSDRNSGSLDVFGYGTYGQYSGNYSYSPDNRQIGAGLKGGVVIYRHGVTFSQPLGDTIALVEAPGASGVGVEGLPGVRTDFRGYTTSNYLTPYQENIISLNPTELLPDVDIAETDVKVVPTRGAVVPAVFVTRSGGRALITLRQPGGQVVPFGSLVVQSGETGSGGVVGDGGQVYLTGLKDRSSLDVKWAGHECKSLFLLPEKTGLGGIYRGGAVCS